MRSIRYLNTVLTIIAILLTLNLWTLWVITPGGQMLSMAGDAYAQGTANAAEQRKSMIDELKQNNEKVGEIINMLKKGSAKVTVESMPSDKD